MLYLTCTTITSIDLAHYGVSRAKDWVSVKYGTNIGYIKMHDLSFRSAGPRSAVGGHLTRKSEVLGSIPGLATNFSFSFR